MGIFASLSAAVNKLEIVTRALSKGVKTFVQSPISEREKEKYQKKCCKEKGKRCASARGGEGGEEGVEGRRGKRPTRGRSKTVRQANQQTSAFSYGALIAHSRSCWLFSSRRAWKPRHVRYFTSFSRWPPRRCRAGLVEKQTALARCPLCTRRLGRKRRWRVYSFRTVKRAGADQLFR